MDLQGPGGGNMGELFKKKQEKGTSDTGCSCTDWKEYYKSRLQSSSGIFWLFQPDLTRLTGRDVFLHIDFVLGFTRCWCKLTVKQRSPQVAAPSLNYGSTSLNPSTMNIVCLEKADIYLQMVAVLSSRKSNSKNPTFIFTSMPGCIFANFRSFIPQSRNFAATTCFCVSIGRVA